MVIRSSSLQASVSGSFRRAMQEIQESVYLLTDLGVNVLSPADPRVVARLGDFMFVASDKLRSVRLVQERHLQAIAASDFLWLVAPDGYVGSSAALEIGYAVAKGVPVLACSAPQDMTLREFVTVVEDEQAAMRQARVNLGRQKQLGVLIDPEMAVNQTQQGLEALRRRLAGQVGEEGPKGWQESAAGLIAITKQR